MRFKKRISLTHSTRSRRGKQPAQIVEPEPTAMPVDEARFDQNEWQWMETVEKALINWDFGGGSGREATSIEMEREAPEADSVVPEQKKKGRIRPMFSALRQKLRRKPKPLLNLEEDHEVPSTTRTMEEDAKEQNQKQPLLTYEQWEKFMDTVAFPEKSKPFVAIKDFVAVSREKRAAKANSRSVSPNDVVQENDTVSDGEDSKEDKMSLAQYLGTQSVDEESVQQMKETGITWEEFMDTVAFPEKILGQKYNTLLSFIAKNRVPPNDNKEITTTSTSPRGSFVIKDDKYAFDDEEDDDIRLYSMVKDFPGEDLGISLTVLDGQTGIFVSHVARSSKAAAAGLTPGMQIISINQDSCPTDLEEAEFLLESVEDGVQIFAQPGVTPGFVLQGMDALEIGKSALANIFTHVVGLENDISDDDSHKGEGDWGAGNGVATVRSQWRNQAIGSKPVNLKPKSGRTKHFSIVKESKSEVVGVAFVQTQDWPGIFVNQILPSSKFYGCGLKKGMRVVSINGEPCPNRIDALIRKIQSVTGSLELCVEMARDVVNNTLDCDSFITTTIVKRGGENPGMTLRRDRLKGGIFVKSIDPYSDFVGTNLRPGLRIMSINGHSCPKDVKDCMWEIQQVDGILDIIAENVPETHLRLD
ncbi:unnamed protein product [Cylindrotheca closterium]|uniref:PDZ domain-containing protein n=1 Tax=Cylindrotheca closterium TaxID=2856 RepID=A0AAD2CIC4_9STRA|nr:unnamed protein product [Cylindrotheca closterium]